MASEIRVDKITSLSGVGTITPSSSGIDITGITTVATLKATTGIVTTLTATTGIVTTLTANTVTSLGAVSGTTGTFSGAVSGTTGTFTGDISVTDSTGEISVTSNGGSSNAAKINVTGASGGNAEIHLSADAAANAADNVVIKQQNGGPLKVNTNNDSVEALSIASDGKIGVNTTAGAARLTVDAASGYSIIANGNSNAIALGSNGIILFGNKNAQAYGSGGYDATEHIFKASASEKVRITSDGDLGIGDNNPSIRLTVVDSGTENLVRLGRSDGSGHGSHTVNIKTSKDFYHNFKMEASSFDLDCYNGSSMIDALSIDTNGQVVVQSGDLRFGSSGSGIVLGNTSNADANTLDDYEEGTWTPSIRNEGTTANWNSQTGKYVKIGQQVTIWFNADGGSDPRSGGSSSSLIMTGLPFSQSMFSNPILGVVGANKSSGTGLYSTSGLILNGFGQGGTQVRFGCGGQAINFSISYVAGCLTYTAAS